MKNPTKKRIDKVAKKLFFTFYGGQLTRSKELEAAWGYKFNPGFHRMAKFVLAELQPNDDYKMPPYVGEAAHQGDLARKLASKRRNPQLGVADPKSCKLVRGKTVCK
jgi:hypothetical protein